MQGRLDALESENEQAARSRERRRQTDLLLQLQSEIVNYRKQLKNMEQENRTSSARVS